MSTCPKSTRKRRRMSISIGLKRMKRMKDSQRTKKELIVRS